MTMEQLPLEVVEKILLHLHPLDRLDKALICRSWAQAVSSPELLEDVWRRTYDAGMAALSEGKRQYRNLRIFGADIMESDLDLWSRVGGHLLRLEFVRCKLTPEALYSILQRCPTLESLEIKGYSYADREQYSEKVFKPSDFTCLDAVRDSLRNLRHFLTDLPLSQEVYDLLLGLMPNATSLSIETNAGYTHPDWYLRDFIGPLIPANVNPMLTRLEISVGPRQEEYWIDVIRMCAESLQDLRVTHYLEYAEDLYSAISDCTKLRHLHLDSLHSFSHCYVKKLVRNSPDLESLDITVDDSIMDGDLKSIHLLQKLRHIGLTYGSDKSFMINALCSVGRIQTLESLSLLGDRYDNKVRSLACLKDLKRLNLAAPVKPTSFNIIWKNFEKLEELTLTCTKLSDAHAVKLRLLPHLKKIMFYNCRRFTDRAFREGIGFLVLEYIYINSSLVTDVGLESMNSHHGRLRKLSIRNFHKITDAGLLTLLRREPLLNELSVINCESLTDEWVSELEHICPRLEELSCDMSSEVKRRFKECRPSVRLNHYRW